MGKKRIKILSDDQTPEKGRKVAKSGKGAGRLSDMGEIALKEADEVAKKEKAILGKEEPEKAAAKKKKKLKVRSRRYRTLKSKIDKSKSYAPNEAVKLLCEISQSKLDHTVEAHFNCLEKINVAVNFPHGTGKKQKIVIADDKVIDSVSKGKIDFDILIASPEMMPKIAKVAKILGPKGLMPNPKTGTIGPDPEALKKRLELGETRIKTEPKDNLIHTIVGKISFGPEKLEENLQALLKAIGKNKLQKAFLCTSQSPSIKLECQEVRTIEVRKLGIDKD